MSAVTDTAVDPKADLPKESGQDDVRIFGLDITHYSNKSKFAILAGIFFVSAVLYGYLQESVFTMEGFHFSGSVTFLTHLTLLGLSGIQRLAVDTEPRRASLRMYILLAGLTMGSLYVTNWASTLLSYSTRTVFKSSKLLSVMLMGWLQRKSYSREEYIAAFILVCSLIFFTLGDAEVRPDFSVAGIVLIIIAVFGDAATVNLEEGHFLRALSCPQSELIFYVNVFSSIGALGIVLVSGELQDAFFFFYMNPTALWKSVMFSVASFVGVTSILTVVKVFGAANMEILKGARKLMTLAVSFLAFAKPWSHNYLYGTLCLVGGTLFQYHAKTRKMSSKPTGTSKPPQVSKDEEDVTTQ
mmetsp:Transcript_27801/g.70875  ORF Transcript_27801/g.70875 Transcript_27801/m.70875 type:complete len:356 (-) Transcript_27801:81-1148(-)|eukprot:CAMPEP_0113879108 /NCGR_PEP_ID=MMETSP0780_2-20120614/7051_1 /TAXON_ID=652834 /ORGANISM="Palpitomonas bilix" /LENGTH=355 /DNA_ID=CAMNT_0000865645 /DNA_START=92 /DNA_END=1159 /DNA_ORIENTATION=+ /assembly_acc=CAM_ASM_000599